MINAPHPNAGKPAPASLLIDVPGLIAAYFAKVPDMAIAAQRVSFGTSGHRGSAFDCSFNETHVLAIAQAICHWRAANGITGPLFLGIDTHALSAPAFASALEVFAANGVETMVDAASGFTPTPVISHAILTHNRGRSTAFADGVVLSPSHNPPGDGGFKYNPPNGGPADTDITGWIEAAANRIIAGGMQAVRRIPFARARKAACVHPHDFIGTYVADLGNVVDMTAIAASGMRIGIDPLGGAALGYWQPIIDRYRIDATVVNPVVDPAFGFMTVDRDGQIRMDCSSPWAMAGLVAQRDRFDIAFANDADADRHGIVTPSGGLMNPNHYLVAAIAWLRDARPAWGTGQGAGQNRGWGVGKTIVSSGMIDRVAAARGLSLFEVPVGFKWFGAGLMAGTLGFGGEESAGAACLRRDGSVWTTDKDGLVLGLLAAEMTACSGRDPSQLYAAATCDLGESCYERIDAPASAAGKAALKRLTPAAIAATELAGEPIIAIAVTASGNGQPIGGIKVSARNGWFAARPSGTEDVYKIYAESFVGRDHLALIQREAQAAVDAVLGES